MLSKIVKRVKQRVEREKNTHDIIKENIKNSKSSKFYQSIRRCSDTPVIGELKKSSPTAGVIRPNFDVEELSQSIERAGAVAISVLTEPQFFAGSLDYLKKVKDLVDIPILRKDFIVDKYQLYRTAEVGADAVLLIGDVLGDDLSDFIDLAYDLGLEPLVEVSNIEQARMIDSFNINLVGINNRNLETLEIDLSRTQRFVSPISNGFTIVSESGLHDRNDVEKVLDMGADAVLIGSAIMKSSNVEKKVKSFISGDESD